MKTLLIATTATLAVLATATQAKMVGHEAAPIGLVGEPVLPRTVEVGFIPCPAEGCDFHYRQIPVVIVQNPELDQAWLTPDLWMIAREPVPYRQQYDAQAKVPNMPCGLSAAGAEAG
jgi:hypothetical protein